MTATTPELTDELEVEYVLWEAEDPLNRPCEASRMDCPNVALYRMLWVPSVLATLQWGEPGCMCGSNRLCLGCKDWVMAQEPGPSEPYWCPECEGYAELKGIEPLRG